MRKLGALALLLAWAACAGSPAASPAVRFGPQGAGTATDRARMGSHQIKHVVWIMQENRSFDNLFQGYPGADISSTGEDSNGNTITLAPISLAVGYDIDHASVAHFAACNGTGSIRGTQCQMNGFNNEHRYCY